jgi:hypothetical protein
MEYCGMPAVIGPDSLVCPVLVEFGPQDTYRGSAVCVYTRVSPAHCFEQKMPGATQW